MNIKINNLTNITIEEAQEVFQTMNISFIIRDGKLKGMSTK